MPTYQFEAMDATGQEIRDVIDAASEDEAQTTIRQMGYFVTKISVKKGAGAAAEAAAKQKALVCHRQGARQTPDGLHAAAVHSAGRRSADSAQLANSGRSGPCRSTEELVDGRLRRDRERGDAVGGHVQVAQDVQPAVCEHDQGRRGRRCLGNHSATSGRLPGTRRIAQAQGPWCHDLPDRGRDGGRRHLDVHHDQDRADVRRDVQGIRFEVAGSHRDADDHVAQRGRPTGT